MKRCWNRNPDFRPPFENLPQRIDKYIREEVGFLNLQLPNILCILETRKLFKLLTLPLCVKAILASISFISILSIKA